MNYEDLHVIWTHVYRLLRDVATELVELYTLYSKNVTLS